MRKPIALAVTTALLFAAGPAFAQSKGLLDSLKDMVSGGKTTGGASALATEDMVAGLKEALRIGTETVTARLGAPDGFNADPRVHIPLPPTLQKVQGLMNRFGLSSMVDDVETRLNRGAEAAMPKARELVWKAISQMTLEDAKGIYEGPENAATSYFQAKAGNDLAAVIKPVIEESLHQAGAIAAFDSLMSHYRSMPMVPDVKADLADHATGLALDGVFLYLAEEEAAIRRDPAKRTTELLARVFGAK